MVPCVDLSQKGTEAFWDTPRADQLRLFHHHAVCADRSHVERISSGTSICVYNRRFFLARGGNDPGSRGGDMTT